MKQYLLLLGLCFSLTAWAQDIPQRNSVHLSFGQYPASLVVPRFSPLHFGVNGGIARHWNKQTRHQLVQSANLAFFHHQNLQSAFQLYTELGYQYHWEGGFVWSPLILGGGYVLAIQDLTTLKWNSSTQQYEVDKTPIRHNWLVSLGMALAYKTDWRLFQRPLTFTLDYRLQVQGILVKENVPLIAYSPLRIGLSLPLKKQQD